MANPTGSPPSTRASCTSSAAARTCTSRSILVFEGEAPTYDDLVGRRRPTAAPRPALPPEARVRAARPGPARVGRRPALQPRATTCATARCPPRAATTQLKRLAARLFALELDRDKPLWEIHLVEGLTPAPDGARFALIAKTHHALVDGVSGVDITSVLFDASPDPRPVGAGRARWAPRPAPTAAPAPGRRAARAPTVPPRPRAACAPAAARAARCAPGRAEPPAWRRWPASGSAPRRPRPSTSRSARTAATRGSTPTSSA